MVEQKRCECGMLICGVSDKHLKSNLQGHRAGNKHKRFMKLKKEKEGGNN